MKTQQPDSGHVFISFTSGDKEIVSPIIDLLKQYFAVWSYLQNSGGARYPEIIEERIRTCSVFVVFESQNAVKSKDVRQEVQLAHKHDRVLLPVIIDPTVKDAFEYQTAGIVRIRLLGSKDPKVRELVRSIRVYKPRRRPRASHFEKESIVDLAWLRPHLVNRTIQEFMVSNFLRAVLDGQIALPGFFLLHGREEECGDVFIQRVAHDVVPKVFNEVSRRGYVHPDQIIWPDHRDDIEDGKEAASARYEALLASAQGALAQARLRAAHGAVFMLQLPIDDWRRQDLALLKQFLSWWHAPHGGFPVRSPLVVIAYVSYGNGILGPSWRRWILQPTHRMFGPKKGRFDDDPRAMVALPALRRISKIDAINWIHKHQSNLTTPDPAIAGQAIARHFRRPLRLGNRRIPMMRAVDALRSLLRDGTSAEGAAP